MVEPNLGSCATFTLGLAELLTRRDGSLSSKEGQGTVLLGSFLGTSQYTTLSSTSMRPGRRCSFRQEGISKLNTIADNLKDDPNQPFDQLVLFPNRNRTPKIDFGLSVFVFFNHPQTIPTVDGQNPSLEVVYPSIHRVSCNPNWCEVDFVHPQHGCNLVVLSTEWPLKEIIPSLQQSWKWTGGFPAKEQSLPTPSDRQLP